MTMYLPTVAAPTTQFDSPQPYNTQNPNAPTSGNPAGPLIPNAGIPAQVGSQLNAYTVLQAMGLGILPTQTIVASYTPLGGATLTFNLNQTPTLQNLISLGIVPLSAPVSTLAFANPTNYGGN